MADKLMYIPNDVTQSYTICRLQWVVETFKHQFQWKSPKLLSQRTRKRYYTTLGTSVINIPLSPFSLIIWIDLTFYK